MCTRIPCWSWRARVVRELVALCSACRQWVVCLFLVQYLCRQPLRCLLVCCFVCSKSQLSSRNVWGGAKGWEGWVGVLLDHKCHSRETRRPRIPTKLGGARLIRFSTKDQTWGRENGGVFAGEEWNYCVMSHFLAVVSLTSGTSSVDTSLSR